MDAFYNPILTDAMRAVSESAFLQELADLDQRLPPVPDQTNLNGSIDESDIDGMAAAMVYAERFRASLYRRELMMQLKSTMTSSADLFHTFLSSEYECKLATTFWGLLTSIKLRVNLERELEHVRRQTQDNERWVVRVDPEYVLRHSQLDREFIDVVGRCRTCQSGKPFRSLPEALEHVRTHERDGYKRSDGIPRKSLLLVRTVAFFKLETQLKQFSAVLSQCSSILVRSVKQARHIKRGVGAVEHKNEPRAPASGWQIEDTFKDFYVFIFALDESLRLIQNAYDKWDPRKSARIPSRVSWGDRPKTILTALKALGENLQVGFTIAQDKLSRKYEDKVRDKKAPALGLSPESMVLWLQTCLVENALWEQMNAVELYQELYAILVSSPLILDLSDNPSGSKLFTTPENDFCNG
jgi:hypothetical protein